jgi:hypothetical protein
VRNVAWIMDSVERLLRKNAFEKQTLAYQWWALNGQRSCAFGEQLGSSFA